MCAAKTIQPKLKPATNVKLKPRAERAPEPAERLRYHVYGNKRVCHTDARGFATPQNRDPLQIVLDATEGFVPLWAKDTTLRWRFQERALAAFENVDEIKIAVEQIMGAALLAWGDAAPVKFARRDDAWDFEIVVQRAEDCDRSGCVLASAFFPDSGRHELKIFPTMFGQSMPEQIETMAHELGHVFGLRHFFASVSETAWASEIFGKHRKFSIMNYGAESKMTATDRKDLKKLYRLAWSGALTHVNGTPIRLVKPFHSLGNPN